MSIEEIKKALKIKREVNAYEATRYQTLVQNVVGIGYYISTVDQVAEAVTDDIELRELISNMTRYYYYLGREDIISNVEKLF